MVPDFSVGVDIETIERFNLDQTKDSQFLGKIFTSNELDYCFSKKQAKQHLAARFAAKEAIVKALYGLGHPFNNLKKIEIINNSDGVPLVNLHSDEILNVSIKVSLSHNKDSAIAFAVAVKE